MTYPLSGALRTKSSTGICHPAFRAGIIDASEGLVAQLVRAPHSH